MLLLLPSGLMRKFSDIIHAKRKGITLDQLHHESALAAEAQAEAARAKTNQLRVETMRKFADTFPGATINDWNAMLEDRTPVSIRLLMALVRRR